MTVRRHRPSWWFSTNERSREPGAVHLFIVTAVFETATGVLLVLVPAVVFAFLLGWREIGQETALIGRVAGAAVLGLSVASWLVRGDGGARARFGLLTGLLIYNAVTVVLLVVAGAVLKMIGLLPPPSIMSCSRPGASTAYATGQGGSAAERMTGMRPRNAVTCPLRRSSARWITCDRHLVDAEPDAGYRWEQLWRVGAPEATVTGGSEQPTSIRGELSP